MKIDPGVAVLSHCPETKCTTIIPENEVVKVLHIYMSVETLTKFFSPEAVPLPKAVLSLMESAGDEIRKSSQPFHLCTPISPRAYMVLQQLFTCPCRGPLKRLYLEAKAMELVALQMESMYSGGTCPKSWFEPDQTQKGLSGGFSYHGYGLRQRIPPGPVPQNSGAGRVDGFRSCLSIRIL